MFVADREKCYGIEGAPEEYYIEKIEKPTVKTNHYVHLPNRNLEFDKNPNFEEWSKTHKQRAEELIAKANNLEDLENILKDRKNSEKKMAICTTKQEEECYTYSGFVFDTKNKIAYYCQGNPFEKPFKKYTF